MIRNDVHPHISRRVLTRPEHRLSRKGISPNAIKVLYRLHRAGYLAYLVGGGVRDLLLGRNPKDFDIGTNASPEEVRRLFKNSRIIGRRFRLVHVFFRGEVVEVSTFRASPEPPEGPDDWEEGELEEREADAPDEPGPKAVREDNTYGSPEEDAWRRDLTINALFYDISDFSIVDWVGGLEDLERGVIRTVGQPEVRFEEDPVRMMRALEYAVRLGFELEPETDAAIHSCHALIAEAVPARLTYELMEGLRSGYAAGIWEKWDQYGLLGEAFKELDLDRDRILPMLQCVDARVRGGARVADATTIAALFLPGFSELLDEMTSNGQRLANAEFLDRLRAMLEPATTHMMVSNQTFHQMYHGLFALTKMRRPPERGRQVLKLTRHESFAVAWDLFEIGIEVGLLSGDAQDAWRRAVDQVWKTPGGEVPEIVIDPVKRTRRRRRRPRRRGTAS
ncbi:MAG: CCA tRNA nucleotidyltransferase [Acidobacteria bacterium]|nr:MAG: CCA tRNA nucleotidyltransferase [Acidobacteriota bacterium]